MTTHTSLPKEDLQARWWALVDLPFAERETRMIEWLNELLAMAPEAREEEVSDVSRVEADFDGIAWFEVASARLRAMTKLATDDAQQLMELFDKVEQQQQSPGGVLRRLVPSGACRELTLDEIGRARHFFPAAPQLAGLPLSDRAWRD